MTVVQLCNSQQPQSTTTEPPGTLSQPFTLCAWSLCRPQDVPLMDTMSSSVEISVQYIYSGVCAPLIREARMAGEMGAGAESVGVLSPHPSKLAQKTILGTVRAGICTHREYFWSSQVHEHRWDPALQVPVWGCPPALTTSVTHRHSLRRAGSNHGDPPEVQLWEVDISSVRSDLPQ